MRLFSKMGKDPKKPKDDATVKKRKKNIPRPNDCGAFFTSQSIANQNSRESCPRKAGPSRPFNCGDCGERFESERAQKNHKRNNVCGQTKKRQNMSKITDLVARHGVSNVPNRILSGTVRTEFFFSCHILLHAFLMLLHFYRYCGILDTLYKPFFL